MQARAIREVVSRRDLVSGTVVSVTDDRCVIELADRTSFEARTAVSCWVQPIPGDLVLVSGTEHAAGHYVLSVLERSEATPIRVRAPAGLEISAPGGSLSLGTQGIALSTNREAIISAATLRLGATHMELVFNELAACGRQIVARAETMQAIGRHASVLLERLHSRLQRSYKVVTEIEHNSAKQLNYQVSDTLSMHCKNGVVTAEELIKLDGKLVQLG
ncbi:MAG TPA: DUF3540 domain-containing protein [Polyangiales bacterium]|nr:DUF3540 domain-containing protein [Polyangiales bacterium]